MGEKEGSVSGREREGSELQGQLNWGRGKLSVPQSPSGLENSGHFPGLPEGRLLMGLSLDLNALLGLAAAVAPQGSVTHKGSIKYVSLAKEERQ